MTVTISITGNAERGIKTICEHERYTVEEYMRELITRDLVSRKDAGWTAARGWGSKAELEEERAASVKKTPPRKE